MKILILCTGNSCRSQIAEGYLKSFDSRIEVFSAGTRPEKEVNPFAIQVMKEVGIDISKNKPKNVQKYTGTDFDYVITVCDNALETCPLFTGNVKNRLAYSINDPTRANGTNEEIMLVYRNIRNEIIDEFKKLIHQII